MVIWRRDGERCYYQEGRGSRVGARRGRRKGSTDGSSDVLGRGSDWVADLALFQGD